MLEECHMFVKCLCCICESLFWHVSEEAFWKLFHHRTDCDSLHYVMIIFVSDEEIENIVGSHCGVFLSINMRVCVYLTNPQYLFFSFLGVSLKYETWSTLFHVGDISHYTFDILFCELAVRLAAIMFAIAILRTRTSYKSVIIVNSIKACLVLISSIVIASFYVSIAWVFSYCAITKSKTAANNTLHGFFVITKVLSYLEGLFCDIGTHMTRAIYF